MAPMLILAVLLAAFALRSGGCAGADGRWSSRNLSPKPLRRCVGRGYDPFV
jgi:hypothetical protein